MQLFSWWCPLVWALDFLNKLFFTGSGMLTEDLLYFFKSWTDQISGRPINTIWSIAHFILVKVNDQELNNSSTLLSNYLQKFPFRHKPNSPGPLMDDWKVTDDSSVNFHDMFFFNFCYHGNLWMSCPVSVIFQSSVSGPGEFGLSVLKSAILFYKQSRF